MIDPLLSSIYPELKETLSMFTEDAQQVLAQAERVATTRAHLFVTPEHVLQALLSFRHKGFTNEVAGVLPAQKLQRQAELAIDHLYALPSDQDKSTAYSVELKSVIQKAKEVAEKKLRHGRIIRAAALYGAMLEMRELPVHAIFDDVGITAEQFYRDYISLFG